VTTADITLIRRHILSLTALSSPHKIIAADVNASKDVTTADITLIRRSFSGWPRITQPDCGASCRPISFFLNATNPWSSPFPTNRSYSGVSSNLTGKIIWR
jgi:hypothetical protein